MNFAKIDGGIVTHLIDETMPHSEVNADGLVISTENKPTDPAAFFGAGAVVVEAPDHLREGWLYDGTTFSPPPVDIVAAAATARIMRDQALASTDWLIDRHRDQIEQGHPTSITQDEYRSLLAYRQNLRDLPKSAGFPLNIQWPSAPF